MKRLHVCLLAGIFLLSGVPTSAAQDSALEQSLATMYRDCLFGDVQNNPFSRAVELSLQALAPGISDFVESNLASIPLAPPSLQAEFIDGQIVTSITGSTPIFTESSATVGKGRVLAGTNFSYYDLTTIRGQSLREIAFSFEQNGGGDAIDVIMPLDIQAAVLTVHGTYGITDRLDLGVSLPVVQLRVENDTTRFAVVGDNTGCRYSPDGLNCQGVGSRVARVSLNRQFGLSTTDVFVNTVSVRLKYRFPSSITAGSMAAALDLRLPIGRSSSNMVGEGYFGTRITFIAEYNQLGSFRPYLNLGGQFWNGPNSNSVNVSAGFNQQLTSAIFFAFDLLGEIDLERDPFLFAIDDSRTDAEVIPAELALLSSTIPSVEREHTLNAVLGLQLAFSPGFQLYGSAVFALVDRGLQPDVAPTAGVALHF